MLKKIILWFVLNVSGKQEIFTTKFFYDVNYIKNSNELDVVFLNRMLLLFYTPTKHLIIGKPIIKDIKVKAYIIQHFFGKKILIFRYKRKKNYKKLKGYKSLYTRIFINNLSYGT